MGFALDALTGARYGALPSLLSISHRHRKEYITAPLVAFGLSLWLPHHVSPQTESPALVGELTLREE